MIKKKVGVKTDENLCFEEKRHLDDIENIKFANKVLKRIHQGKERTYTLEEVEQELGLAN